MDREIRNVKRAMKQKKCWTLENPGQDVPIKTVLSKGFDQKRRYGLSCGWTSDADYFETIAQLADAVDGIEPHSDLEEEDSWLMIHVMLLKPETYKAETDEGEFQEAILFYAFVQTKET